MGQPAYAKVTVSFESVECRDKAQGAFTIWADQAVLGKLPPPNDGDFDIYFINGVNNTLTFEVGSGRYANCVWQCERIRDFFKEQSGVLSIEQDVHALTDSINWYKNEN